MAGLASMQWDLAPEAGGRSAPNVTPNMTEATTRCAGIAQNVVEIAGREACCQSVNRRLNKKSLMNVGRGSGFIRRRNFLLGLSKTGGSTICDIQ